MILAQFTTEKVEYIVCTTGYSRNGSFTEVTDVQIHQLTVGESAAFSYKIGKVPYRVSTDPVKAIRVIPARFLKDIKTHKVRAQINNNGEVEVVEKNLYGSRNDVSKRAISEWPNALINIEPLLFETKVSMVKG